MRKRYLKRALILLMAVCVPAAFIGGCAAPQFKPAPYTPKTIDVQQYDAKADVLMILLDASASMTQQEYNDQAKINIAQDVLYRLNETIPEMDLQAGMRLFGQDPSIVPDGTELVYGITDYRRSELSDAITAVPRQGFITPMGAALEATGQDLNATEGPIALVLVSDGIEREIPEAPLDDNLRALVDQLGDRLCIHSIGVGNFEDGIERMKDIAEDSPCGTYTNADELTSAAAMADFVEKTLLSKRIDSDGDGVYDRSDDCPNTPAGVAVDDSGCASVVAAITPADSDGDGVADDTDKCRNTPQGVQVGNDGCRTMEMVHFEFDESNIQPRYEAILDDAAQMLRDNPQVEMEIHGHTDDIGTPPYNQELSERRARSVKQYLIDQGIDGGRLSTTGHGERQPIATNETAEGRAENRRAELKTQD